MASSPSPSFSSLPPFKTNNRNPKPTKPHRRLQLFASSSSSTPPPPPQQPKRTPGVDTRIHWDNQEDGWLGVGGGHKSQSDQNHDQPHKKDLFGERFADLINSSSATHYQFLGVEPDADMEEIKAAYRKLSKEYHPDTTTLPLKTASEKFMQLREAYNVLSNEDSRRFYDWTLAQEAESLRAERMRRMSLEDPFEQDIRNHVPVPDMVDRLGGRNMQLSDQAYTALTIDIFIIFFCICCFIYAAFFKEQY